MAAPQSSASQRDRAVALLRARGALRLKDFRAAAIGPQTLARLLADKVITRPARGIYQLPGVRPKPDGRDKLAQAAERVPKGVVCLTSALAYHGLTLQTVNRRANLTRDRRPILTRGGVPVHRADRRHFNALPLAALLT